MSELRRTHLRWGWLCLFAFSLLGFVLEGLHAFKVGWYLDFAEETRRLMFTLAHAHGTVLALVHFGFAATLAEVEGTPRDASLALRTASIVMPLGFFLGGIVTFEGDPHPAVVLVPLGAIALMFACVRIALLLAPRRRAP